MGDIENSPFKIAQVVKKFKMIAENNTYFLNVGPKVDIAFIVMCAFAIDELFSDQKWNKYLSEYWINVLQKK